MDASEFLNFPLTYGKRPIACSKSSVLTEMLEDSPELPISLQSIEKYTDCHNDKSP